MEITSSSNPTFKTLLSLLTSKGIKKENQFFLMGQDLIFEFFKSENKKKFKVINQVRTKKMNPLSQTTAPELVFPADLFAELDIIGTNYPMLVLQKPDTSASHGEFDLASKPWPKPRQLVPVLPLGDPSNLGAALRSCQAFGATTVLLTEEAANPYLPKSVKSSAGAVLNLYLHRVPKLKDCFSKIDESYWALDQGGISIHQAQLDYDFYLFVGEEGPGFRYVSVPATKRLTIPMQGTESLNAVVALSVALFEHSRQIKNNKIKSN